MGIFNLFGKKPDKNTPVLPAEHVIRRILELNRDGRPFQIIDGKSEGVDLIGQWKIVDARWQAIFAKANLTKVFRIYLKLDASKNEVRAKDQEYSVEWRAGVPGLSAAVSSFQGQQVSVEFGAAYAFTENGELGRVYNYRFNTGEIKKPIQDVILACGWIYKGIAFGKL